MTHNKSSENWFTPMNNQYTSWLLAALMIQFLAAVLCAYTVVTLTVCVMLPLVISYDMALHLIRPYPNNERSTAFIYPRLEIQLGPRPHAFLYWICNFVSFAVQSYVIFEAGKGVAHEAGAATYICCFLSCLMIVWESSRARAPGHGAGALVDDIAQFSKTDREATPRERASILSTVRFNWALDFMVFGKSHILTEKDYPPLVRDARTFVAHQELETLWYEESSKENPSLPRALMRLVRKEMILSGVCAFIARILLKISMPVLLYYFIRFLETRIADPTLPILPGFLMAGAFALSQMAEVTAWNFGNFIVRDAAVKIQSSLINNMHRSIFSKTKANGEGRASGDIINIISSDVERVDAFIEGGLSGFHDFWLVPGVLAVYLVMLYQLLGFFAFIPIAMFITMMIISKLWGRVISRIQSRMITRYGDVTHNWECRVAIYTP
ncbi:hypothetical protein ACMFMG_006842 [Clarireedia jacksonii]